jgi:hypothetical protein
MTRAWAHIPVTVQNLASLSCRLLQGDPTQPLSAYKKSQASLVMPSHKVDSYGVVAASGEGFQLW